MIRMVFVVIALGAGLAAFSGCAHSQPPGVAVPPRRGLGAQTQYVPYHGTLDPIGLGQR
jgi:hypothetical protein